MARCGAALLLCCCSKSGTGKTLVNRAMGKCLDLHAPCEDGSHEANCSRVPFQDLTRGSNLQLFHCSKNQDSNQEFEVMSTGRIRNPLTGLCIDIQAPCRDHFRTPCERIAIDELQERANIQLWDCQADAGRLSNSVGNQIWALQGGALKNVASKLCLDPKGGEDMSNIHAATCSGEDSQVFDLKLASLAEDYEDFALVKKSWTSVALVSAVGAATVTALTAAAALAGLRRHGLTLRADENDVFVPLELAVA